MPRKIYTEANLNATPNLTMKLNKDKVDLIAIHKYLSDKLLSLPASRVLEPEHAAAFKAALAAVHAEHPRVPVRPGIPGESGKVLGGLMECFTNNAKATDPLPLQNQFRENGMLRGDETVAFAFQNGRDCFMLTDKRLFMMDTRVGRRGMSHFALPRRNFIPLFYAASEIIGPLGQFSWDNFMRPPRTILL